jgi:hypothetical protein
VRRSRKRSQHTPPVRRDVGREQWLRSCGAKKQFVNAKAWPDSAEVRSSELGTGASTAAGRMSGCNGQRGRCDTHRRAHKDSHRRLGTGEPEEYASTKVHAEVFVPVERPLAVAMIVHHASLALTGPLNVKDPRPARLSSIERFVAGHNLDTPDTSVRE